MRLFHTVFLSVAIGEFLSGWRFVGSVWVCCPIAGFPPSTIVSESSYFSSSSLRTGIQVFQVGS